MNDNYFTRIYAGLVRRRHDELVAAGVNPDLRAVQHELHRLDALRLTETEIAEHLIGEPLTSGRRGRTQKSERAASASRRASRASRDAELDGGTQAHFDAHLAHFAAACAHRTASEYHDEQAEFHRGKANPKTDVDETPADTADTGADETQPVESHAMEPICCARSLPSLLGDTVPEVIMWAPAGLHTICPARAGKPIVITLMVDAETAATMERQRAIMAAGGDKPFFSIEHSSDVAAFWPTRFFWAARPDPNGKIVEGVWAEGEWSQAGREAVEGKNFRSFSPTFFTNTLESDADNPAFIICNPDARLNLGSLVNDAAFGAAMSPLWPDNQPRAQA